jgi:hypothetical protein
MGRNSKNQFSSVERKVSEARKTSKEPFQFVPPKANTSMAIESKTASTIRNNKQALVVPRVSDPNGFMSIDLTSGFNSLQQYVGIPPSGDKKRVVQKMKAKH